MKNPFRLVVERDAFYPIHSIIASHLSIKDIRNVKLVCKEGTKLYEGLKETSWGIESLLRPYFTDTKEFCCLQSNTENPIAGELVADFFRRTNTDGRYLNLFTQTGPTQTSSSSSSRRRVTFWASPRPRMIGLELSK
jgi:hypothetical protein